MQTTWGICSKHVHALRGPDPIVVSPSKWALFCACLVLTAFLPFLLPRLQTGIFYVNPSPRTRHVGLRQTRTNASYVKKVVYLAFASLNVRPALQMYFSLKCRLQTDSIRLFSKCWPHKWMLFAAPRLHIYINISTCLVRVHIALAYKCGPSFT